MSEAQTQWQHLERKPGSNYKQLFIKGTRIMARTLYGQFMSNEDPQTMEQIAAGWDLPIEVAREAMQYCQADPPATRDDFQRDEERIARRRNSV
jgi:uncharacterized protein (DUF433 family)